MNQIEKTQIPCGVIALTIIGYLITMPMLAVLLVISLIKGM